MSVAANQHRIFLLLLAQLRPHWRRDPALPARLHALLAARREFGARDRRLYRELVYTSLRFLPWIEPLLERDPAEAVRRVAWLAAATPATAAFRAHFATGEPPAGDHTELLPAWFRPHCPALFAPPELAVQLQRAPLWLRLQCPEPAPVFAEFAERGWSWRSSNLRAETVALTGEVDVTRTRAWQAGAFEVQDLGSQLVLAAIGVEPRGRWLDACAGAGGKSLQLAHLVGSEGRVDAADPRAAALAELRRRAARARLDHVRTVAQPDRPLYDGVLVDAPCSGSGTWRRSPHLKWVTAEATVAQAAARQLRLLQEFSAWVRPGGLLVYATCSLSRRENEDVVAAFRATQPEFAPAPLANTFGFAPSPASGMLTILPARHDTDGFFVASLRRA